MLRGNSSALEVAIAAKWLDAGASTLGAKVHKFPTAPDQVPGDGEFRYVILGPVGQPKSGKPSAFATRFCEEVTGPQNPRAAKNAIVVAAPDRVGLAQAQEKVRDYLAWLEVKGQLSGRPVDPVRSSMLHSHIIGSKKDMTDALRQAYCIVVTRNADDTVHAWTYPGQAGPYRGPMDLACLFRNSLQAQPALIGMDLRQRWVRKVYPIFCEAVQVDWWPPPYKDFAHELAELMPRRRREIWSKGKRIETFTVYLVPNPEAAVVETVEKLERA